MANNSYISSHDFHVSHLNGSWSEYIPTALNSGLERHYLDYVNVLKTFPTWISNSIFKAIYASGILANIVLLVYLIYYKRYKTPVFCVILSLGFADLCALVAVFLYYSCVTPFILGPLWLCSMVIGLMDAALFVSCYHVSVFAVLRFIQLVYPLTSHAKVTIGLMRKVCLIIWSIFTIFGVAMAFHSGPRNIAPIGSTDLFVCLSRASPRERIIVNALFMIFWIIVPFTTTIGFHVAKQVMVVLSRSSTVTSQNGEIKQVRKQTDSRALAIVILVYIATMVPYVVQNFRRNVLAMTSKDNTFVLYICYQISYSNSAINPFIYLFASESVRSDLRKMITFKR